PENLPLECNRVPRGMVDSLDDHFRGGLGENWVSELPQPGDQGGFAGTGAPGHHQDRHHSGIISHVMSLNYRKNEKNSAGALYGGQEMTVKKAPGFPGVF